MNKLISILAPLILSACTMATIDPGGGANFNIDLTAIDMRHGWAILTQPKRVQLGVNDEASINRGKMLYIQYCLKCHGPEGSGDGEYAQKSGIKPANLKIVARKQPNSYLVVQIIDGKGAMPSWQELLNTQQLWDLTNYIQTLNK